MKTGLEKKSSTINSAAINCNHKQTVITQPLQTPMIPIKCFMRLWDVIGSRKKGIQGVLPISRSSFLAGVKSGIYPAPVKLGVRTTAWRAEDISVLLEKLGSV